MRNWRGRCARVMETDGVPRLRNSIASLSVLQVSHYLVPLITLPYLTRVLGPDGFGAVAYVQAVMISLMLLTDYALSWSATREIAARRNDRTAVSRVFRGNWGAQWLLTAGAGGLLALGLWFAGSSGSERVLHAIGFAAVIGNALFPIWLFQGLERMAQIAWLQVSARLATVPLIFGLVRTPDDVCVALAIQSGVGVVAGVGALFLMARQRWVDWQWPTGAEITAAFKEGFPLFLSKLAIGCYTSLVPVILGAVAGTTAVAYFSLADKVRAAAQSLLTPIAQALYPRLSHLYASDAGAARDLARRALGLTALVAGTASLSLFIAAVPLIALFGGPGYEDSVPVLHLMALLPLVIGLSNVFGVQVMLPNRLTRPFNVILGAAASLGLIVVWPLAQYKGAQGAAAAMLLVELFVTAAMGLYLARRPGLWRRT
jgi:O-antigen/teichoic acid export membrane protein